MLLKLFISAVPATILGWMIWDVLTLREKINQLQLENHIRKKAIEGKLEKVQNDIKNNQREIDLVFRQVN